LTASCPRVCLDARLTGFPGIGRFIVGLWGALRRTDLDLVVLGPGRRREDWLGAAGYAAPGPVVTFDARPFLPGEQLLLPSLLKRSGIDVHHSPHLTVPYLSRRPIVLTVHDLFFYKDRSKARSSSAGRYYRAAFPAAVRRASVIVAGSPYARRELTDVLGVPERKLRTIDYGLDHDRFRPVAPSEYETRLLALGVRTPYLLYVGTAKPHKNLTTLLAAHRGADLPPLVLAGPTPAELDASCPTWQEGGRTVALGRVPDEALPSLYSAAMALAIPSLYESLGFPAVEAMACGTAVVASDGGGLPDTVGDDGLLVPATDVGAWRESLTKVVNDESLQLRLAEAGRQRAALRDWSKAARRYTDVYRDVAG